jgi:hypothetical protein
MERPDRVLGQDVLSDLEALTATWDEAARARLLDRVLFRAECGDSPAQAFIRGLSDLLEGDG